MDRKDEIRRAVLVEGKSQRQAAKEFGHSRNTIRKMLENSQVPEYKTREKKPSTVLRPYEGLLDKWVEEDAKKVRKKRRTAKRMYNLLRENHGYSGAESTVRRYVGLARRKAKHKVFVPLAYEPGEVAQVDFGETEVVVAGRVWKAQLFHMWLGYSGCEFVKAYPAQTQEVFFDGHVAAFEYFGGVPRNIWYDNLKAAVAKVLKGRHRQEQDAFISLRSHYLFDSHFCQPAAGWEKGGVEGRVGYCRRNWLIGAGEFASWDALNVYLLQRGREESSRRLRGREKTKGENLVEEQAHLLPLPTHAYACCKTVPVKPNHLSFVTFATNRYSVPAEHAHNRLLLRAFVDRIELVSDREVIATHRRCWEREQDVVDPRHYLALLAQRPRAFEQSQAIRQWRERWPEAFDRYWEVLKGRLELSQSTKTFVQVLQLCNEVSETTLASVLTEALVHHCYTYAAVRELLRRHCEQPVAAVVVDEQLAHFGATMPTLSQFDQLVAGGGQ